MSEDFWLQRMADVGHTGWFDQRIYAFDQLCRLAAFERWLRGEGLRPGKALDFGCGTGDFCRYLVRKDWSTIGYDKHVTPKFVHERLLPTKSLNDVACQAPYDLIISVTVLDHIMEEEEFHQRLQDLRRWLVAGGKFFFLEWSAAIERTPFSYRGLRTLETWRRALSEAGFVLNYVEPFFHPSEAVIPAWTKYRSCPPALGFRPLRQLGVPLGLCRWAMSQEARLSLRLWPYSAPAESPINILSGIKAITVR